MSKSKAIIQQLFALADIAIDGSRPWDIRIHNPDFYSRVLQQLELGLGETYMAGWWDCDQIDAFICRLLRCDYEGFIRNYIRFFLSAKLREKLRNYGARLLNSQSRARALIVGKKHYDISNDFYQAMLDKRMNYSCGYWKDSSTLDEAQEAKLELICRKLQLKPGMKVLDIGCGWGAFSKYAAEKYDVSVVGITISKQQQLLANELCAGLPVTIRFQDYRDLNETFDRICSIGMFEHVGYKNYRSYMRVANRCLKDDGLFLLHTIGRNFSITQANPWIQKYIFPNGALPSIRQIGKAAEKLLVMEDWHNFGADYDKTLMAWHANFNQHWSQFQSRFGDEFYRMWNFYLLGCAGVFRARDIQLWQIVFSKKGLLDGYCSVR